MSNCSQLLLTGFAAIVLSSTIGCGSKLPYEVVKLEGTVTYKGEPLENVIVHFRPAEGRESNATTTGGGRFAMRYTHDVDGVQKGPGKFFLSMEEASGTIAGGGTKTSPALAEALRKYTAENTTMAVEITESSRDYQLKLQ